MPHLKSTKPLEVRGAKRKQVNLREEGACLQKQEVTQLVKVLRPGVPAPVSTKAYVFPDRPSAPHRGDDKVALCSADLLKAVRAAIQQCKVLCTMLPSES